MAKAAPKSSLNIVLYPSPCPSHQTPLLQLTLLLSAHQNIQTTIITTTPPSLPLPRHVTLHLLPSPVPTPARSFLSLHPYATHLIPQIKPDIIISDWAVPWTAQIARDHNISRILFYPTSAFSVCVSDSVNKYRPYMNVNSDIQPFLVPGLPDRVGLTRTQLPARFFRNLGLQEFSDLFSESENYSHGAVFNSFGEIEPQYVNHFQKIRGKIWEVGPLGLFVENITNEPSTDTEKCLTWLDSKQPGSVVYICFGNLCVFAQSQLVEIGLGLETSKCNFIWVVREGYDELALDDLEDRVKSCGLVIKGWAPQAFILDHKSVGGFVSHCGWNSVLEAISYGVPIVAWPLFGDQFYNAQYVTKHLRIGFGIKDETGLVWGEEERAGVLVKRTRVAAAVTRLMGRGGAMAEMKEQVSRLSTFARAAVSEGGSSSMNLELLIEDLFNQKNVIFRSSTED